MLGKTANLDRLVAIDLSSPLVAWVLGVLVAYVLVTDLVCVLRKKGLLRSPATSRLLQAARFLFFLGVPYLALGGWPRPPFSGLLALQDMGLVGQSPRWPATRWLEAVGDGLGLGLAALAILLLAWANANRARDQRAGRVGMRFPPERWWSVGLDILALEVHWAFFRAAPVLILGDLYAGVFVGLGLVYLEWGLSALWWRNWQTATLGESVAAVQWLQLALALVSAVVFLVTQNLWVCLAIHALVEFPLRRASSPRRTARIRRTGRL